MTTRPFDNINSVADLKRTATHLGNKFFTPGAMRFFRSRIASTLYRTDESSGFFITSEQYPESPRHYEVREYYVTRYTREDGRECDRLEIDSASDHYDNIEDARAEAKRLVTEARG